MRRFIQFSELKPEKVDEYIRLHAEPWPELLELMHMTPEDIAKAAKEAIALKK